MTDAFEERRRALEGSFFEKENNKKLEKIGSEGLGNRPSPITGKPMLREVFHGITIDRCNDSNGVWLDNGELEELLRLATTEGAASSTKVEQESWIASFLSGFTTK
jgi:hypothetical protein